MDTRAGNDLIMIPADVVARVERQRSRMRLKEARRERRNHHGPVTPNCDKPFVGWDGEGPQDTGYSLLGSSLGPEICYPRLKTRDCLNLILDTEQACREAVHISFGFNYDVSNILRELPWRHLSALKTWNRTEWDGYEIEHIPGKWFMVKRGGVVAKIFDIRSFFGGSYVQALLDMNVGTAEEIAWMKREKLRRPEFLWSEIDTIKDYYRLELRLMPLLAGNLREAFLGAGFDVRSWHGPGALANMAMRRHHVRDAMAVTPEAVRLAAQIAFAGGRFENPRGGFIQRTLYVADKRSAYPSYARDLPNLARGTWRHGRDYEPGKFGMYRIRYKSAPDPLCVYPLFRRLPGGEVVWSHECEGWYWGPEAGLVAGDKDATFLESLIFDEDDLSDRPFAWIEEYYLKRQYLKRTGSVLELTFKLIINSIYGQLAQRTGWDRKNRIAPRSHQLEWAGYITSACRAAIWTVARQCGNNLISIDTDGVTSMVPFGDLDLGTKLGQWELKQYDGGIFWQSGIYMLKRENEWVKGRARGIPKGKYRAADLLTALENGEPLRLTKKTFIGYGLAINGRRDEVNTWVNEPVKIVFGGEGKRYHNGTLWCGKIGCRDGIHDFIARPVRWNPGDTTSSARHALPWLGPDLVAESRRGNVADMVLYDANHLAYDDEWVMEYA